MVFYYFTFKTSKVVTVITRHVIPSVPMLRAKCVHTVLVFVIVWLVRSPETKAAYFSVCPHKRPFNASVIQPNPGSVSVMTVLNVNVFFLIVDRDQMRALRRTI